MDERTPLSVARANDGGRASYRVPEDDVSASSSYSSSAASSSGRPVQHGWRRFNKLHAMTRMGSSTQADNGMLADPFLAVPLADEVAGQSSSVAIFSLCSNMLGSGVFVIPWAMAHSGVGAGLGLVLVSSLVLLYTCRLIVQRMHDAGVDGAANDLSDLCRLYLGKWGHRLSNITLVLHDLWLLAIQWIIMTNCAFYAVAFIADPDAEDNFNTTDTRYLNISSCSYVNRSNDCRPFVGAAFTNGSFDLFPSVVAQVWSQDKSVPAFLACTVFPLLHFRRPSFFAKFNPMIAMSVVQVFLFIIIMGLALGSSSCASEALSSTGSGWHFPSVVAVMMFSLNIHRIVIPIMRNQRRPSQNLRDLNIAFLITSLVYMLIGAAFVISFPNAGHCTQQIFMDNFEYNNFGAFNLRSIVLVQLIACFPLKAYVLRSRAMQMVFGHIYPSPLLIFLFNCVVTVFWILVAQHITQAADVVRFTGAFTGVILLFCLPIACQMSYLKANLALSYRYAAGHLLLIFCSFAIVIGQFFVRY